MDNDTINLERLLGEQVVSFPHRRLFVGYSGGLDSTLLLDVAAAAGFAPTAIHINHGLHAKADVWQRHCAEVCRRLGVAIKTRTVQAAGGEAGFRDARYAAYDALVGAGDLLLLGHHRNDQAETVLMRLVQGREPLAMPRIRPLPGGGRTLKPWLALTKDELVSQARRRSLDWIEDPSNTETAFDRNFLRHRVMTLLTERWPDAVRALAVSGEAQTARDELLGYLISLHGSPAPQVSATALRDGAGEADARSSSNSALPTDGRGDGQEFAAVEGCPRIALHEFPPDFRLLVLRYWLRGLGEFSTTNRALAEFVRQLDSPADRTPSLSLKDGTLRRHHSWVLYDG